MIKTLYDLKEYKGKTSKKTAPEYSMGGYLRNTDNFNYN